MNRLQSITGVSPAPAADRAKARPASDGSAPSAGGSSAGSVASSGVAVEISAPVESGPPVDTDRVAEIRSALRDGTYPLVPAKIADAMIAAQLKFEIE
jgi:negative regulator of flagellin synthesis FlgM